MVGGHWRINGYEGLTVVFQRKIPTGQFSDKEVVTLLQRLAARHLTDNEIVLSSLRRNSSDYVCHLEIQKNTDRRRRPVLRTVGSDYHYIATIVDTE